MLMIALCCSLPAQSSKQTRKGTATAVTRKKSSAQKSVSGTQKSTSGTQKSAGGTRKSVQKSVQKKRTQKSSGSNRNQTGSKQSGTSGNATISSLKNQNKKLQDKIREQERLLQANKRDVTQKMKNLYVINSEIEDHEKSINIIQGDLHSIEGKISALTDELDTLGKQLDERKNRYIQSMRYMHRQRSIQNQLMFIFSAAKFSEMYRRMRFCREYAGHQRAQGEQIMVKQQQIEEKKQELEKARGVKTALLIKGQAEHKALQGKQAEQKQVVASLQKQQKTIQSVLEQQRREAAELNAKIEQMIAEEIARQKAEAERRAREAEERRRREEEAARQRELAKSDGSASKRGSSKGGSAKGNTSSATPDQAASNRSSLRDMRPNDVDARISGSFESNRGRLPMPITGPYRLVSHFGQYNVSGLSGVRLDNKGINLQGQSGAQARAIFDGVVSAIFDAGGAMVVMVRHGEYISVYCNLVSVSVRSGQRVSTRQSLGSIGDNHLHFQLRRGKALLNPENWLR